MYAHCNISFHCSLQLSSALRSFHPYLQTTRLWNAHQKPVISKKQPLHSHIQYSWIYIDHHLSTHNEILYYLKKGTLTIQECMWILIANNQVDWSSLSVVFPHRLWYFVQIWQPGIIRSENHSCRVICWRRRHLSRKHGGGTLSRWWGSTISGIFLSTIQPRLLFFFGLTWLFRDDIWCGAGGCVLCDQGERE